MFRVSGKNLVENELIENFQKFVERNAVGFHNPLACISFTFGCLAYNKVIP